MAGLGIDDPVVTQAIEWMVQLRSGMATSADFQAFAHWRHADSRHDAVCKRIERTLGRMVISHLLDDAAPDQVAQPITPACRNT